MMFSFIKLTKEINSVHKSSFPKYQTKKAQEFRHIYLYSIVHMQAVSPLHNVPKIFVILQLESVRHQQGHNPLAYMMYIHPILSLQCIIGRFSNMAFFRLFLSREGLCCHVLGHISRDKSKTGQE